MVQVSKSVLVRSFLTEKLCFQKVSILIYIRLMKQASSAGCRYGSTAVLKAVNVLNVLPLVTVENKK